MVMILNCSWDKSLISYWYFRDTTRAERTDWMWLYLVELEDDAADAPDVAGLRPAQLEDDLRGAVVPRRHHRAVVLPVERRRTEVDQFHPIVVGTARIDQPSLILPRLPALARADVQRKKRISKGLLLKLNWTLLEVTLVLSRNITEFTEVSVQN